MTIVGAGRSVESTIPLGERSVYGRAAGRVEGDRMVQLTVPEAAWVLLRHGPTTRGTLAMSPDGYALIREAVDDVAQRRYLHVGFALDPRVPISMLRTHARRLYILGEKGDVGYGKCGWLVRAE